ncbi:MAG: PIN domain-containing protein [Gemmatimonadota bacterium]
MSTAFSRAPHIEGSTQPALASHAPNAALLVDFDNVTMGMRSDLSKELKTLLGSDIIKGKVTVQRAYADWRRYPQYIVPLSEASIDLIFAPAYGSSKKNATDIRMAIDGMELVFTRPEIGTYILLTGDSDFSSLVLKLKEYGKYVIGVGIQESSSDILVQNCDEYYSYTSLSGLRRTSDPQGAGPLDPWVLVERALEQMRKRNDVMRSDRLKQVMLELDPGFEEKSFGFSKFSRFLSEAAKKGILQIRKMENGQYEVMPAAGNGQSAPSGERSSGRDRDRKEGRGRRDDSRRTGSRRSDGRKSSSPATSDDASSGRQEASTEASPSETAPKKGDAPTSSGELAPAYDLLRRAILDLAEDQEGDSVRDSDVKRRMLALDASFDEGTLGFSKFSRFLRQAHDHEVVDLRKSENGQYQVAVRDDGGATKTESASDDRAAVEEAGAVAKTVDASPSSGTSQSSDAPTKDVGRPATRDSRRLRPRLSSRRRGEKDEPPPLLEGQVVGTRSSRSSRPSSKAAEKKEAGPAEKSGGATPGRETVSGAPAPGALNLPTGRASTIKYLSNSYAGVGQKTAETLVDELGEDLFRVLQDDPGRVEALLPSGRAEKVLEGWKEDYARRRSRIADQGPQG